MGFEDVDTRRCSICGVNQHEVIRAHKFLWSGANNDYRHTSNPYYAIAWKISINYQSGKYYDYCHTGPRYTDIDYHDDDDASGYHKRCLEQLPVAKPM